MAEIESISGTLYIVSTPIGNLEDITLRAKRILSEVDLVAAEDTRKTGFLLNHYGIKKRLVSFYSYNQVRRTPELIKNLLDGKNIAVVSDAGTPGISDPASYLVKYAVEAGVRIEPVPGASALLAALVVSGLDSAKFVFDGFLPVKKGRKKRIQLLSEETRTIVLYESPHRIVKTLKELHEAFGDRDAVIGREITKKFEEFKRGTLSELLSSVELKKPKGEFVLVLSGRSK